MMWQVIREKTHPPFFDSAYFLGGIAAFRSAPPPWWPAVSVRLSQRSVIFSLGLPLAQLRFTSCAALRCGARLVAGQDSAQQEGWWWCLSPPSLGR